MISLDKKDAKRASAMCARAFLKEPFYKAVFPNEKSRLKKLKSLFYFRIKYGLTYGKVYTSSEEIESVAI